MRFINKWGSFINEEWSKNDPIPEITRESEKLGIILLGVPGSGKSTFANTYIKPHNRNIKTFSTDDVSLLFTKDSSKYHIGSTELNLKYLDNYIQTGQNFVYDTTGSNQQGVFKVSKAARKVGYKLIFILLLTDLETAKRQNTMRGERGGHTADEDYIDFVYSMQRDTTRDYLKYLKPDGFYIVLKKEAGYKFMKFSPSGELLKRKVDKYVSFIKESTGNESEVDKIVDTMLDFIDEGERITFKSSTGEMTYTDYLEKNERYQKFKPVLVSKNKTVSKFSIVYSPKNASYDNLMVVLENMQSTIGRLGGDGWTLSGFEVNKVFNIFFEFTRPSIHHDKFELPDEDELRDSIINLGFSIDRLVIGDSEVELDYDNESWDYSGSRFSEETCEDKFGRICDIFGFGSFDLDYRRSKVIFEY
jgi:predicted ABC-type ATPase